jgi:hypothetical protein
LFKKIEMKNKNNLSAFSYVGFGAKNMAFAPPVGFNLTFSCPDKQVFESDWFARPFVMMTCQVRMILIFLLV